MQQTYTYEQVRQNSINYFEGDTLAAEVFASKYALQDLEGNFHELTPSDMHRRLAKEFARIERKYKNPMSEEEIYGLLSDWSVVAQGGPMSGIGNPFQVQSISNCFVIDPPADSYGGIMLADQEQVQIMKRRGGVGHDISCIRPKGLPAANAARTTDGVGVFMDRFSNTTREVAQGGRRGALMLSMNVHHPEIDTFINIKRDKKRVTGANVSVRVTDEFMKAVVADVSYNQRWPVDVTNPKISRDFSAGSVWDQMMQAAWESAEPGVLFWDTIIRESPADCYAAFGFRTISTNPCGELPLPPYDSCRLLLMNLLKFVLNPYTNKASFDLERFRDASMKAQRLMDDLVDLEIEMIYKIIEKIETDPENEEVKRIELNLWKKILAVTANGRRTGLGATALGDALAALGIRYGSDMSIFMTEIIYQTLGVASYESSIIMAAERGPFTVFVHELESQNPFIRRILESSTPEIRDLYNRYGRRNIANLTTSPAGTVSIETQTTSGMECAFKVEYDRRKKITTSDKQARVDFVDELGDRWQTYTVYHHGHLAWARINGKDPKLDMAESPYFGATSADIDWLAKVRMQAAAQKWIDHSISNTTNVPNDTPLEVIKQIYMTGWELGCKGITVYREGSRAGVLISSEEGKKKTENKSDRPDSLQCDIHFVKVGGKQHVVIVGLREGLPYEIFFGLNEKLDLSKKQKHGIVQKISYGSQEAGKRSTYDLIIGNERYSDIVELFDNPNYGAFTRILSTTLRHGVPVHTMVEQMRKDRHSDLFSFSSVIARLFSKHYIADGTKTSGDRCTQCKSKNLSYQQGCMTCVDCGNSKCS